MGMTIGEKIRLLREQKGLSPERLGMLCDISGGYIRKLETGQNKSITLETARKLAIGLEIDPSVLIDVTKVPSTLPPRNLDMVLKEVQNVFAHLDITEIPLRGSIPMTYPIDLESEPKEFVKVPKVDLGERPVSKIYALTMSVNDLINDKICTGDMIIVDSGDKEIIDGKIYVICHNKNINAKHIKKLRHCYRVSPDGHNFKDVIMGDIEILGRVIESIRILKH